MLERFRAWRLERARLLLADEEDSRAKWGFADYPSEAHRRKQRIEKFQRKVKRLERAADRGQEGEGNG